MFEVRLSENTYDVNTTRMTCTCGKWQITGIPCEHAHGAMIDANLDVEKYISEFFSTSIWRMSYSDSIKMVRGPRFWMKKGLYRLVVEPPEPILPRRKKKKKQKKFPRIKGRHKSLRRKTRNKLKKLEDKDTQCIAPNVEKLVTMQLDVKSTPRRK